MPQTALLTSLDHDENLTLLELLDLQQGRRLDPKPASNEAVCAQTPTAAEFALQILLCKLPPGGSLAPARDVSMKGIAGRIVGWTI